MSSTNSGETRFLILGRILVLVLVAAATIMSGKSANFFDPSGLLFVLAGGVALVMISFPGAEIRRALSHAAGFPGSDAEIRRSALFWEAAARGVWMLGVLRSILNLVIAMADQAGGLRSVTNAMARSLLATFYGVLLAVVCFVPYWKLTGELQNRAPAPNAGEKRDAGIGRTPRLEVRHSQSGMFCFFQSWHRLSSGLPCPRCGVRCSGLSTGRRCSWSWEGHWR